MGGTLRAAGCIVTGLCVLGFSDNLVPLLDGEMSVWQAMAIRSVCAAPFAVAAWVLLGRSAVVPASAGAVALRSLLVATALLAFYSAMPATGTAFAAAGLLTSPLWILVISGLFLGVRIGPLHVLAVATGFAGIVLILGIGRVPLTPLAALPPVAGLFYALMVIWTRRRCAGESPVVLAFWQMLAFFVLGLAGVAVTVGADAGARSFVLAPPAPVEGWHLALLLLAATATLAGSGIIAMGYQSGRSEIVGIFDFSFLVWAPLWAHLLRGEAVGWPAVAGMALVAAAGALALRAGRSRR